MKLWGGRFTKGTDKGVEEFTSSISFDCRMYREDIAGSIAHARMLANAALFPMRIRNKLLPGLRAFSPILKQETLRLKSP